jgi:hypothetical protein
MNVYVAITVAMVMLLRELGPYTFFVACMMVGNHLLIKDFGSYMG